MYLHHWVCNITQHTCSACPLRTLTTDQKCSAVCPNKDGHRDAVWNEGSCISRALLSRLPSLEQSKRWGLFFVMPFSSLVGFNIREEWESHHYTLLGEQLLLAYAIICSKVMPLSATHAHCSIKRAILTNILVLHVYIDINLVVYSSTHTGADPGFPGGRFTAWVRMCVNIGPRPWTGSDAWWQTTARELNFSGCFSLILYSNVCQIII